MKKIITKKIEGEVWKNAIDESFKKNVKNAKIDGFREGKCPRNIFEKKYGVESLYNDAIDFIMPNIYSDILKETKLIPIIQPSIDIKSIDKDGVEFEFIIVTEPEVEIKNYKNLNVKKKEVKVSEKEVLEEVNRLRENFAEIEIKDGKAELNDTVVIDFEGFKDGVAFEGGKGDNYPLELGSNTFIPGFEEQLVGLKANDEKDIKVTFPDEYPSEDLKGKEVTFKVKVNEVKTRVLPEINDEFFDDLGIDVHSEKELKEHCKKDIEERKEKEADNKFVEDVLAAVAKETKIELDEELIHDEIHNMIDMYSERLQMQGLSFDSYLKVVNKTMEDIEKEIKPEAEKNLTYRFMLNKIASLENIIITEEKAKEEIEKIAIEYEMTKEEVLNSYGSIDQVISELKIKNTIDFLKENNMQK